MAEFLRLRIKFIASNYDIKSLYTGFHWTKETFVIVTTECR